ncbi:hypothetical protein [Pannus brasiliensis]|uniref:hypothetical protein n=1 Tax=Pannus brasiliensis TaxID=1579216 RepID=UPI002FCD8283
MSIFSVFAIDRQDAGTLAVRSGLIERSRSPEPDYAVFQEGKKSIDLARKEAIRPEIANEPLGKEIPTFGRDVWYNRKNSHGPIDDFLAGQREVMSENPF